MRQHKHKTHFPYAQIGNPSLSLSLLCMKEKTPPDANAGHTKFPIWGH